MSREDLPSLLLLPPPPDPVTRVSLNAAYRPPLETALSKVKNPRRAATLIVALACPILNGDDTSSKTLSWPEAQSLLAGLYTVISAICAKLAIGTEMNGGPESVDARVVLVDYDRDKAFADFQPSIEPNDTVVVDLPTFAAAYHPWNYIFHVESEAGLQLHSTYLKFAEGVQTLWNAQLVPVDGGLTMRVKEPGGSIAGGGATTMSVQTETHQVVCLGGTFDYLHPGHKLLLTAGALLLRVPDQGSSTPCQFVIGVTGDELLRNKKYAEYVQPWDERARNVIDFLGSLLDLSRAGWEEVTGPYIDERREGDFRASFRNGAVAVQCVCIHDPFGPTITREDITCLVVSAETRAGGAAVNERRAALGWHLLDIFEVDVLDAEEIADEEENDGHGGGSRVVDNFASKISSTAIRQQKAEAAGSRL